MSAAGALPQNDSPSSRQSVATLCLMLLVAGDLAFILLHVVNRLSPVLGHNPLYHLGNDGGYAEIFQYLKTYWIAIMLGMLCSRTREAVYVAWGLLYAYLLCDDAMRVHETLGGVIAETWSFVPAFGLRAKDFGELAVSAVAGCVLLGAIAALYPRAGSAAKSVSRDLALLLGILVFFGVCVDMVHMIVPGKYLKEALGIVEDGGELVAMSATFWYVLRLLERRDERLSLWHGALRLLPRWTLRMLPAAIPR